MVETWQVLVTGGGLLVTVLGVYGAFIRHNYDWVTTLRQRILGASGDATDDGYLERNEQKLDDIQHQLESNHSTIRSGMMENRQHVKQVENAVNRVEYKVDVVASVVEDEHDVRFRGGDAGPPADDD